jgi:GntR family transcriptional regulator/MocR family aminotransferase
LTSAFSKYLPEFEIVPSQGGSGAWVKGPESLNSQSLSELCIARGVLIEPGDIFFSKSSNKNQAYFRLGYSAIHGTLIDAGVREIQKAFKDIKF